MSTTKTPLGPCVIYCRRSTKKQKGSLIRQLSDCRHFASKYGFNILASFVETHPGHGQLHIRGNALDKANRYNAPIIVESLDRWSRENPPFCLDGIIGVFEFESGYYRPGLLTSNGWSMFDGVSPSDISNYNPYQNTKEHCNEN